jgi:hypothetical protein
LPLNRRFIILISLTLRLLRSSLQPVSIFANAAIGSDAVNAPKIDWSSLWPRSRLRRPWCFTSMAAATRSIATPSRPFGYFG